MIRSLKALRGHAISASLLAAALLSSCGGKSETKTSENITELIGSGSTFIQPIMTHWVAAYKKETGVSVNYQAVGSGAGINNLLDHTVDFAGSDAPMTDEEIAKANNNVIHLPAIIGAVCVSYNIPGIETGLKLSGDVIAKIYLNKITYWDDAAIKSMNADLKLPHEKIFTIHRSDGSGTTAIFTNYLSAVSPEWKSGPGDGKSIKWDGGIGGKGNEGVAGVLKQQQFSIGYVELAYAEQNNLTVAHVKNAAGNFVAPTPESASLAADGVTLPADNRAFITNTTNAQGYPITGFSWLIVYKDGPKSEAVKKFVNWVVTKGQSEAKGLYYAPIPAAIQANEIKLLGVKDSSRASH